MKYIGLVGLAALGAAWSAPASATSVINGACVSVSHVNGCRFETNINTNTNGNNNYLLAQAAYNALPIDDIFLNPIVGSTDTGNIGSFGTTTGFGTSSGTWSLPGYDVRYIAVKASQFFVLYEVSGSSGNWHTNDIPFRNNPHAISHLVFFGDLAAAVPEPGTWALMILGFGVAGAAIRQQRKARVRFA